MPSPDRRDFPIAEFLLCCALVAALEWALATSLYRWLAPQSLQSLAARAADKRLQDVLLLSLASMPWLICFLTPRLKRSFWRVPEAALLGGAFFLEIRAASWVWVSASLAVLCFYAREARKRPPGFLKERAFFPALRLCAGVGACAAVFFISFHRNFFPAIDLYEDGPRLASANAYL